MTMETSQPKYRDRVSSKRTSNACVRCRRLKIKCSGSQPCHGCLKRQVSCEVDPRDQKIVVSRGYIMDLQQSLREAEQRCLLQPESASGGPAASRIQGRVDEHDAAASQRTPCPPYATPLPDDPAGRTTAIPDPRDQIDPASSTVANPLSLRHTEFTLSASGTAHYMGTSSNWSFTRRVLNLAHAQLCDSPAPPQSLLFDGAVYTINWDTVKAAPDSSYPLPELPTLDHAIYLINTVQFNCCQLFHLFDKEEFMYHCHRFYASPKPNIEAAGLWYLHFCFVIALDFFLSIFRQFPCTGSLIQQPLAAVEILCCAVLCLQCIDHRYHAHIMIGEAVRIALFNGWHTDMRAHGQGDHYVERCRRAWWTVYVLDREMTSLLGIPVSIHDDDINCPLPVFGGQPQRMATLNMQVKLCRIIADISQKLYGNDGSVHCRYLSRAKLILRDIANLSEELRGEFPLQPRESLHGISRTASHLHLLYHRCITLVTRPLLYYLLKMRFSSSDDYFETLDSMKTVRSLVRLCIETSQSMVSILECLMNQGLLGAFFPYDTEAVFVSTTNLLLGPAVDSHFSDEDRTWLDKAHDIFDDMISHGNQVAKYRKEELKQLGELLAQFKAVHNIRQSIETTATPTAPGPSEMHNVDVAPSTVAAADMQTGPAEPTSRGIVSHETETETEPPRLQMEDPILSDIFGTGFTREHLMGVSDAINDDDMVWMCETILAHDGH